MMVRTICKGTGCHKRKDCVLHAEYQFYIEHPNLDDANPLFIDSTECVSRACNLYCKKKGGKA